MDKWKNGKGRFREADCGLVIDNLLMLSLRRSLVEIRGGIDTVGTQEEGDDSSVEIKG